MARNQSYKPEIKEFEEKVVQVNRVSKKTKGGNKIGFSVLVVVGDKKGRVGVGLGKAPDVLSSIKKGIKKAKKKLITVPLKGTTIPFRIEKKFGAAHIMLKPASKGTGVIAGGAVRAVVEAAGIRDIVSKILGSSNKASNVYATFAALKEIERITKQKGISIKADKEILNSKIEVYQPKNRRSRDNKFSKRNNNRRGATPNNNQPKPISK